MGQPNSRTQIPSSSKNYDFIRRQGRTFIVSRPGGLHTYTGLGRHKPRVFPIQVVRKRDVRVDLRSRTRWIGRNRERSARDEEDGADSSDESDGGVGDCGQRRDIRVLERDGGVVRVGDMAGLLRGEGGAEEGVAAALDGGVEEGEGDSASGGSGDGGAAEGDGGSAEGSSAQDSASSSSSSG